MKIAVCSDLHLEFGGIELTNTQGADVLVLSGDIMVAADLYPSPSPYALIDNKRYSRNLDFFTRCSEQFPNVVYVMGNHEHYHGDFATTTKELRSFLKPFTNIHLLDKEVITFDDITFIGGTLWTDMNKCDPITLYHMRTMMNDFRCVKNSTTPVSFRDTDGKFHQRVGNFSPDDAVSEFMQMVEYIRTVIEGKFDHKFVVCGHHAPSRMSTHPRYQSQDVMNGGYSSSLDEFIMDHPQIKLWTHGHTHENFDYMIGSTRVVCNPRGYDGYEERAETFELKYVEV
jgi:Icc-related predicted phosphoesterase